MASLVESVLQAAAEKESKFKPVTVQKDIELEIDEGNLLAVDRNPIELKTFRSKKNNYLTSLARDNTQLLINRIWELKVERVEDTVVVQLPPAKTILPREKPIPKAKPETRWSAYAKLKGIKKRKKGRMVWDDTAKEWRPRWGYKRAGDLKDDWVLEVPDTADPYEDQFEKKRKDRKERIAKNELQRLRNIARNMKGKGKGAPGVGLLPTTTPDKSQLTRSLTEARRSTASVGRFTDKLPKEKPEKGLGKKRKFEPNFGDSSNEKRRALDILQKITNKNPTLDVTKATNQQLAAEERIKATNKADNQSGKKGRVGGRKKFGGGKSKSGGGGKKTTGGGKKRGKAGKGGGRK